MVHSPQASRRSIRATVARTAPASSFTMAGLVYLAMAIAILSLGLLASAL